MTQRPKNVEEFIARAPAEWRGALRQMRAAIRKAAPRAVEKISYGMPYYSHQGRLAYFRHAKSHLGLYIPTPVVAEHKRELKGYSAGGATIRFPLGKKLPIALIQKLVRARLKMNEAKGAVDKAKSLLGF